MKALLTVALCYVCLGLIGCDLNSIVRTQWHGLEIILAQFRP